MADESRPPFLQEDSRKGESSFWNVSWRGWMAMLILLTLCAVVIVVLIKTPSPSSFKEAADFVAAVLTPVVTAIVTGYLVAKQYQGKPPGS